MHIHPPREQGALPVEAAHHWDRIDGSAWMQRHDLRDSSLLRLPGLADFIINVTGTSVDAWPTLGMDREACQQLYLNNVLPMALSRQSKLVLHASAVEVNGGAVVFVGVSGRGKSTLATCFAREGHALIVDDGLVVESRDTLPMALPGESAVRLRQDSEILLGNATAATGKPLGYADKRRIPAGEGLRFTKQPVPIRAVFLLGEDPAAPLSIRLMPPALAMIELIHYSFLLDVGNPTSHATLMQQASALAACCGVHWLDYPRDYAQLPMVCNAIRAHVACLPGADAPP